MGVADLKAIFPDASESFLSETLARYDGDDNRAVEYILSNPPTTTATAPPDIQKLNLGWAAGGRPQQNAAPDNYFFGGAPPPIATTHAPYATTAPNAHAGGGVNAAAHRRIAEILSHEKKADIDAALQRHNGGLSAEDEEAALNFLLNNLSIGGDGGGRERAVQGATAEVPKATVTTSSTPTSSGRISASHTVFTTAPPEPEPAVGTPVVLPHQHHNPPHSERGLFPPPPGAVAAAPAARPPPNLPPTQALSLNAPPPRLSGRKKALLIGNVVHCTPRGCVRLVTHRSHVLAVLN